jgi:hypothetical protein
MKLTPKQMDAVLQLIGVAWQAGSVRSPQDAMELEQLKLQITNARQPKPRRKEALRQAIG